MVAVSYKRNLDRLSLIWRRQTLANTSRIIILFIIIIIIITTLMLTIKHNWREPIKQRSINTLLYRFITIQQLTQSAVSCPVVSPPPVSTIDLPLQPILLPVDHYFATWQAKLIRRRSLTEVRQYSTPWIYLRRPYLTRSIMKH